MKHSAFLALALAAVPVIARADAVPRDHKHLENTIVVEATPPADKVLILTNSVPPVLILEPGKPTPFHRSNRYPGPEIRMVAATEAKALDAEWKALEAERKARDEKAAATGREDRAAFQKSEAAFERVHSASRKFGESGVSCAEPLRGVRSALATAPYDEVRAYWSVTFDGARCTATLARTEYLDKAGKVVDAPGGAASAASAAPAPVASTPPAPAPVASSEPSAATATLPSKSGCGACNAGQSRGTDHGAALLLLALALGRRLVKRD